MSELAIVARPILGGVQGHLDAGKRDPFPDPARLLSALVHAAGTGTTAIEIDGDLRISPESMEALTWLEEHPPSALQIPESYSETPGVRAFRDEGVLENASAPVSRKVNKEQTDFVAFASPLGWGWEEDAPTSVVETIEQLCADVSCLGESDTPVVLEVGSIEPTYLRDSTQTGFPQPGGLKLRVAKPGRLTALETQYQQARPKKVPSASADKHGWSLQPRSEVPTQEALTQAVYRPITPPVIDIPWVAGVALTTERPLAPDERVAWCVTLHRALIARLGDDAPATVTGVFESGVSKPANHVAIHYVQGPTQDERLRTGGFIVSLPAYLEPSDAAAIESALKGIHRLVRGAAGSLKLSYLGACATTEFWMPPLPGMQRCWFVTPAFVPETRRPRTAEKWTFADSALLSIGFVFRERLETKRLRGEARYLAIRDQVANWGVEVISAHRLPDSDLKKYLHKIPNDLVAQPVRMLVKFTATSDQPLLISDETLFAIGQSRHVGGGLLEPHDIPIGGDGHGTIRL